MNDAENLLIIYYNVNIKTTPYISYMFSILIPLYNGVEFLKEALDSVQNQTFTQWEVIIGVNGHPQYSAVYKEAETLALSDVATRIRVIDLYDLVEKGKSAALNAMLPYTKFSHIAILDVDDIWLPTKLEKQLPFIQQGYDVVGSQCEYFGQLSGNPSIPLGDISTFDFFKVNPIINSSAIVRKDLCQWRTKWDGIEDYDMWLTLRKSNCRFYNVGEVLVRHRIHQSSSYNSRGNGNKVPDLLAEQSIQYPKYRIRVFCGFGDSAQCKGVFERLCETDKMANYGPDKEIYITNDEDYTHAIIMNITMPDLKISKDRVIGLAFEPTPFMISSISPEFITYAQKQIGKY